MRWTIRVSLALLAAWAAFAASPYLALYQLAKAVEDRDLKAIRERVNLRAVRLSLTKQLAGDYLARAPGARELQPADKDLAAGVGAAIADSLVARLLAPEALLDLLDDGWPQTIVDAKPPGNGAVGLASLRSFWRVVWTSQTRGFRVISVGLPPDGPADEQMRMRMRFRPFSWRVTAIELPAALRQRLVDQLLPPETRRGSSGAGRAPAP